MEYVICDRGNGDLFCYLEESFHLFRMIYVGYEQDRLYEVKASPQYHLI